MMNLELERAKIKLLEDMEKVISQMLVLCYADRKATGKRRKKVIMICKKWQLDIQNFLDDEFMNKEND